VASARGDGRHSAMLRTRMLLGASLIGAVVAVLAACGDESVPQPCSDIPAGGCPLSRGLACEDPACEAVYLCRPGNVWELHERCPLREAGTPPDADVDVDVDAGDAGPVFDAAIDAPPGSFGGPGCASLQAPDCALGLALACGAGCCGCEDLYICADDGWSLWGSCGEGGPVPDP